MERYRDCHDDILNRYPTTKQQSDRECRKHDHSCSFETLQDTSLLHGFLRFTPQNI